MLVPVQTHILFTAECEGEQNEPTLIDLKIKVFREKLSGLIYTQIMAFHSCFFPRFFLF